MAKSLAYCSACWNPPPTGKDKLAGAISGPAPTKSSDTSTLAPAVLRVPTPAPPDAFVAASSWLLPLLTLLHPWIMSFSSNS